MYADMDKLNREVLKAIKALADMPRRTTRGYHHAQEMLGEARAIAALAAGLTAAAENVIAVLSPPPPAEQHFHNHQSPRPLTPDYRAYTMAGPQE